MSAYVEFYAEKNGTIIELGSYSRSNPMYHAFCHEIPYEGIVPLTEKLTNVADRDFKESIDNYKTLIKRYEDEIELIKTIEAPLGEKLERINDIKEDIEDLKQEIEISECQKAFLNNILRIEEENNWRNNEPKTTIYVGIECGMPKVIDGKVTCNYEEE